MNSNNPFKAIFNSIFILGIAVVLTSCGGSGGGKDKDDEAPETAATATIGFDIKTFRFTWTDVSDATFYRLMENPDGVSGFTQVSGDIAEGTQSFDHIVPLYQRINASYILQSCNDEGCTDDAALSITSNLASAVGYFKASNTDGGDEFGIDVALSSDGSTLAVGAQLEDSTAVGEAGAVYVYVNDSGSWSQQAYITSDSPALGDNFGAAVSLSSDGGVLAVGTPQVLGNGVVKTFTRNSNGVWSLQDSITPDDTGPDSFGNAVSLSDDGTTLAVGAKAEASSNLGINTGDDNVVAVTQIGAAYIFNVNAMGVWTQEAFIKADNASANDQFGFSVGLSSDGNTLVVGAPDEDSSTSGIGVAPVDTATGKYGAVYVFTRAGATWMQEEFIKASDSGDGDSFGISVSLSDDGDTLAVGAVFEESTATDIDGDDTNDGAAGAGAAYVFSRSGTTWTQQAYVKASNTDAGDNFGRSVSLSASGDTLAVGAQKEAGNAKGINGDETNSSLNDAGAAYVYTRTSGVWSQQAYVKASNTRSGDFYGTAIELSGDGDTLAVGASLEDSAATGVGGSTTSSGAAGAGAVYLY